MMGHYGLANWYECLFFGFLSPLPDACYAASIHTSPGVYGYCKCVNMVMNK